MEQLRALLQKEPGKKEQKDKLAATKQHEREVRAQ